MAKSSATLSIPEAVILQLIHFTFSAGRNAVTAENISPENAPELF